MRDDRRGAHLSAVLQASSVAASTVLGAGLL
jgi:hypothetical protein